MRRIKRQFESRIVIFLKSCCKRLNGTQDLLFLQKKFCIVAVSVPKVVEDVGLEPLFLLPKQACYHYTTSSVWWSRGDLHPCPKSLHEQDLLTQYTVSQRSPYGGSYATVKHQPRAYNGLHTSTTLFLSTVTRKTAMAGCFFDLRRLPISSWCVVLEIQAALRPRPSPPA